MQTQNGETRFLLCGLRLPRCVSTGLAGWLSCRLANESELDLLPSLREQRRRRERVFLQAAKGPLSLAAAVGALRVAGAPMCRRLSACVRVH